jgi:hypothetical protein
MMSSGSGLEDTQYSQYSDSDLDHGVDPFAEECKIAWAPLTAVTQEELFGSAVCGEAFKRGYDASATAAGGAWTGRRTRGARAC